MSEPFLGEIRMFGFNFAPQGWAFCNGQTLPIAQNTALFALLGTQYGGNGQTTFALPNLQSRVAIHQGTGVGLSNYQMGETGGVESVTLISQQMPAHSHPVNVSGAPGTATRPDGAVPARATVDIYAPAPDGTTPMNAGMIGNTGGSQPHTNIQPYLAVNFCIALQGIFPSRN
ncbi:MAG TPA: tail fiber protein [Solirubrobacteraceae bacterium]|jgi:microcystin-dependent protein|nr:tail fiber protein [Solirubrobacteraceae bacterium]